MKTLLVTGATGVLAKRFISKFGEDFQIIRGMRNPTRSNDVQVDSWAEIISPTHVDAIIHFAGKYLVEDSAESTRILNDAIVGTATALTEFSKIHKTPIVALGSYFEKAPQDMQPWSNYTIAKQSAAKILELASIGYKIPIRYLYAFDTYGDDLSRGKIVDALLEPSTKILDLSRGEQRLNLTHEDDFVRAVKISLDDILTGGENFEKRQVRNPKDELTLRQIAEIINYHRLNKIELNFGVRPYRKKEVFKVWDCAPSLDGWSPHFSFEDFVVKKVGSLND